MKGAVSRLRAELRSDRAAFAARIAELEGLDLTAATPAACAQAAVALHHAYGAVEAGLGRVARLLEGSLPSGAEWHHELLHAMTLDVDGVRPRILSEASVVPLRKLLGFRHFFRHAYAVALDAGQLERLRDDAVRLRAPLEQDLNRLDEFLKQLADAL